MPTVRDLLTQAGFDWDAGQVVWRQVNTTELLPHHDPRLYDEMEDLTWGDEQRVFAADKERVYVMCWMMWNIGGEFVFVAINKDIGKYLSGKDELPYFLGE